MSSEADILASLRAKNAERQRRYRERHKGTDAYRASNTERQRRYRERQRSPAPTASAPNLFVPLADRILAHLRAHPGADVDVVFRAIGAPRAEFIAATNALILSGRIDNNNGRLSSSD